MEETLYGYTGKLLRVNLTEHRYSAENIPRQVCGDFVGGRGFIAKYLYDEIPPGADPMGDENKIVFAVGPLTATRIPSSGRYAVGTRSPHTGAIIRSISGGQWGALLKKAGYDALILEGRSPEWIYLSITEDGVEFRDARHLLGLLTEDTEAAIQKDLDNPKARSCVIGPAGEKLVSFACIQTERRSAGRGGVGCAMGGKKVKGIAVFGRKKTPLFKQQEFDALIGAHIKTNIRGDYYAHFHDLGTTGGVGLTYTLGVHPVKNFQRGEFEGIEKLLPEGLHATGYKANEAGCWNCYMRCGSLFDVPDGPFAGKGYENPEYETMWSFGANCMNDDFAAILAANRLCDDYGADTISTGNGVGFLMECYEKGYITKDDLNGVALEWGDGVAMVEVARQILTRSSRAGAWVADGGVRNAAKQIGRDAMDFAMQVKGLELPAYDPRGLQAHGLGYATSNMGGHHQIGYSIQEIFGFPEHIDRFSTKDKGRHTIWSNRFVTTYDCAVVCGMPNAFTESKLDFTSFPDWLQLVTGMPELGSKELMDDVFDRIYTLERAFNVRMGFTEKDDTLPKRLLEEPLPDGPAAGHVWKREEMLRDYYEARGWDPQTGVPMRSTLERLRLGHVADDLEREGFLARQG